MYLYGQDIDDGTTPIKAAWAWLVKREKVGYIGYEVMSQQMQKGVSRLRSKGRDARAGRQLIYQDRKVGVVTSRTYSPILRKGYRHGLCRC